MTIKEIYLKKFRERFVEEGTHSIPVFKDSFYYQTQTEQIVQFVQFLDEAMKASREEARECPRHHEQLRCLDCLNELASLQKEKEKHE